MIVALCAIVAVVTYEFAAAAYRRRFPYRSFSYRHDVCFALGVASIAIALSPWADAAADAAFSSHMLQHVTLMLVAPPLLLLGAPFLVAAGVARSAAARAFGRVLHFAPLRILTSAPAALLLFVGVLWAAHFSPLYEASLEHEWIHILEHAVFFGSALLFWMWVLPSGSLPRPVPYPVRLLLLFLALPQGAFIAIALQSARDVLYAHYAATQTLAQALADQRAAGEIMWIGGGTLLFVAFVAVAAEWASTERGPACA